MSRRTRRRWSAFGARRGRHRRLNHPNICTIYEIGESDGARFIAMEYLEGTTLKHAIAGPADGNGDAAFSRDGDCGCAGCGACGGDHSSRYQARKHFSDQARAREDSGFRTGEGRGKTSSASQIAAANTMTENEHLTSPGSTLGTVAYMSPEQVLGKTLDARTDLFSFGIVLYEMATGALPFKGDTSGAIFDAVLHGTPAAPGRLNPQVPAEVERVIQKALEKDREVRYQHASEMRADLARARRDTGSGSIARSDASGGRSDLAQRMDVGPGDDGVAGAGGIADLAISGTSRRRRLRLGTQRRRGGSGHHCSAAFSEFGSG